MFWFQFITTPTADTPGTTLLLHFDNQRYLFGSVSEGTQRACIQRGIGLGKVRNIFISGPAKWQQTGGLIGMILTLAGMVSEAKNGEKEERPRLTLHGGPLLTHGLACGRRFVFRTAMPVTVNEFENSRRDSISSPTWSDENIEVWAIPGVLSNVSSDNPSSGDTEEALDSISQSSVRRHLGEDFVSRPDRLDEEDQKVRRSVVSMMFESNWRRDQYFEKAWSEVQQPAATFLRDPETKAYVAFEPRSKADVSPDFRVYVRDPWPAALTGDLPKVPRFFRSSAISYIVRGQPQRGVFDLKKAQQLKIPRGPMYAKLASGESVQLEDGTLITPDQVLGPTKQSRGIAIIDLPSRKYVQSTLSRPEWDSNELMGSIEAVVWILGPGVEEHLEVQSFMLAFPHLKHIVSSIVRCPNYLAMDSCAASAIRLSRISREQFPVPRHDNVNTPQISYQGFQYATGLLEKFNKLPAPAQRDLKIMVEPKFEVQTDEVPPLLDTRKVIQDIPANVHRTAKESRREVSRERNKPTRQPGIDPEIITLGTGSAQPSKYRNVSATLLRIPRHGTYLFDCGENTIGQLLRLYDPKDLKDLLLDLKMIWISHLHADHHLGLIGVLKAWKEVRRHQPQLGSQVGMVVASGPRTMDFLTDYGRIETLPDVWQFVCEPGRPISVYGLHQDPMTFLGHSAIEKLQTCYVRHCKDAMAISITFKNGFKFSYSGDCRPSKKFANIGRNSDVLVHEATFDDDMGKDAADKRHSTTGEALGVAALMQAKNVVLTHFSQRYQKIPMMANVRSPAQVKFEEEDRAIAGPDGPVEAEMEVDSTSGTTGNANAAEPAANFSHSSAADDTEQQSEDWFDKVTREITGSPLKITESPAKAQPKAGAVAKASVPKMSICVAFDYMRIKVSDIQYMHHYTPALNALFEAEHPEMAEGADTEQDKSQMLDRSKASKKRQSDTNGGASGTAEQGTNKRQSVENDDVAESANPLNPATPKLSKRQAKKQARQEQKEELKRSASQEQMVPETVSSSAHMDIDDGKAGQEVANASS